MIAEVTAAHIGLIISEPCLASWRPTNDQLLQASRLSASMRKLRRSQSHIMTTYYAFLWIISALQLLRFAVQAGEGTSHATLWNLLWLLTRHGARHVDTASLWSEDSGFMQSFRGEACEEFRPKAAMKSASQPRMGCVRLANVLREAAALHVRKQGDSTSHGPHGFCV